MHQSDKSAGLIIVTGASGFLGTRIARRLHGEGYTVRALGRRDPRFEGVEFAHWNASAGEAPVQALEGAGAIVHLAGEPVAQRWNPEVKRRIRDSRVTGTRNLVSAISRLTRPPQVLVAASAIGFYGDRGDQALTEADAPGNDFMSSVCVEWEREAQAAGAGGVRVALLRMGIVLGREAGALKRMIPPFRAGVGGPVGSGRQWVSWIHVEDVAGLIRLALGQDQLSGPVNVTSPNPVRNSEFAKALGAALHRPALVHTPRLALRILFGEMAEVVLASQRVLPEAALRAGYTFRYPELRQALAQIFSA